MPGRAITLLAVIFPQVFPYWCKILPIFFRYPCWPQITGFPDNPWIYLGLVFALTLGLGLLLSIWPPLLARLVLWLPFRLLYRIRVFGPDHVPKEGPVLLVCNHVSFVDAFLIFLAQKRPIRFILWAPMVRGKILGWLLRRGGVILIDHSRGARSILPSLRAAQEALKRGEAVCFFAEGTVSRTGFLLPFHRSFKRILKRCPARVVPVCIAHVWGSIFSFQGGKFFWKWPQKLPYPVSVAFGQPLSPQVSAAEVRQAIEKLSADCAVAGSSKRPPVHRQFLRMAARHPFRPCLLDSTNKGKFYRYGEVLAGAGILAGHLHPLLGEDKMVGAWLPPSAGGALANIALALLGKTSVNLNYTSSPEVVLSAIRQCGIRRVLTSRLFLTKVPLDPGPGVELVYLEEFRAKITRWQRLRAFLAILLLPAFVLDRWVYRLGHHDRDDLATVIFSSGSTGDPKGVMLSHRNISANVESMIQAIDPRPSDRVLGVLPFFHSFGYTVTLWVPLLVGASTVYHADPRQAKEIGELCRTFGCTLFLATPTFLRFCLRRCGEGDFKTLRVIIVGAEKLPSSLAQEFQAKFGVLPLEGYGCTELAPVAAANVPDWEEGGFRQINNRPGTIGRPVPGVAARIVNPDTFEPTPPGQDGLLLIYGANVMVGYLGRPEATREVVRDGWYVTGDIARLDEDGFITITDRLSRFSKIGGEMVPHQKVEDVLHAILQTSERVCVVTAVPDERKGERLIVLHTSLVGVEVRQVWQQLNSKGLPNLWVPGERDFFEIKEVPVLGSGKVDLKRAKEIAMEKAAS